MPTSKGNRYWGMVWPQFLRAEAEGRDSDPAFWEEMERLHGEQALAEILHRLTRKSFDWPQAQLHWRGILEHQQVMRHALGRPLGLRAALCDYFINVRRDLRDPILVEEEAFRLNEERAIHDGLTGLFNRHYFNSVMEKQVASGARFKQPFSLIMADVDNFKLYNDRNGHPAGDQVLRQVARVLEKHTRAIDYLVRYGGEEFAIVLPRAGKEEAVAAAERHRAAVAQERFLHQEHQPSGQLTISLGVASYPSDAQGPWDLVHRSDAALYEAKRRGRNQVWSSGPERRQYPRVPFQAKVDYRYTDTSQGFAEGESQDISLGGLGLRAPWKVERERPLEILIHIDHQPMLRVNGRAVRVMPSASQELPYQLGVALGSSTDREAFRELVITQAASLN